MKTIIGIILIGGAIFLGYLGITGLQKSSNSVEVLGIDITAEDKGSKQTAYIQLGGAVILLIGGIYLAGKKK
ncbi:hypothetical protein [uncultured Proteiniphilum sp.]|uniref:hypothetical protein n=1 Tax=uncultured Proteiniphilum sp. TaxID=497637 RepID=UPI00261FD745|nr:hypothetical protein [uncultured Proteiniphilum sp.]